MKSSCFELVSVSLKIHVLRFEQMKVLSAIFVGCMILTEVYATLRIKLSTALYIPRITV